LDLGICMVNNNTDTVMCHGYGPTRASGASLDLIMSQIREFMIANPYEVVTVEFNEYDGDAGVISKTVIAKVNQFFTTASGQPMYWTRNAVTDPWPTLRDMILADKRLMIFVSDFYNAIPDPKPNWANQKDLWKMDGFRYTHQDTFASELNASYHKWCDQGPANDGSFIQWQQIDIK